ncbi:hypothetical protein GBA52_000249 [Prunus armeniaca]|nr:hypothetical protein GBA52_000249 [Prunus armeniaca]
MEACTSLLSFGLSSNGLSTLNLRVQFRGNFNAQEKLYGKPVTLADRETVEEKADQILSAAAASNVAFLVAGDPFGYAFLWNHMMRTLCIGFARLGSKDRKIVSGKMNQLHLVDFGAPLHCLVIASNPSGGRRNAGYLQN